MCLQPAPCASLLERGVWKAPWMGPRGEMVLLVVTSKRRLLVPPVVLSLGSDYISTLDTLWATLDVRDPAEPEDGPRRLRAI